MAGSQNPLSPDRFLRVLRPCRRLLKALPRLLHQASVEWVDDNAPRLGAAVAFYTLLSLAPVVVIVVAVAAAVYGQDAAQGRLAWEIRGIAGPDVARTIEEIIAHAYYPRSGMIATVLGLATLAYGASSIFVELRDAMNTIWHVSPAPDRNHAATVLRLIRDRFYSFATVLAIGFLLLVSLVANAWMAAMRVSAPPAANFLATCLVVAVLFGALYKILPDVALKWSDVALGAVITSLLFMLGNLLMGAYFADANFGSSYRAAGSPLIVLLWVYYSAQILFWGAEFCRAYTCTLGSRSGPQF
jgi:membrane protein